MMARFGSAAANSPDDAKIRTQTSADEPDVSAKVEQARRGATGGVAADDLHDRLHRNLPLGTRPVLRQRVQLRSIPAPLDSQDRLLVKRPASADQAPSAGGRRRAGRASRRAPEPANPRAA